MKQKIEPLLGVLIGVVTAVVLFVAIGRLGPPEKKVLKVGYQPNLIYLPVFVAEDVGLFDSHDLEVSLVRFPSANEMLAALKTGDIHITGMSSLSVVARTEATQPGLLRLLTLEEFSPGASPDAIVVPTESGIHAIGDLKGKTIGTWPGSTIKMYTELLLQSENLTPNNDYRVIPISKVELENALREGAVDAAFTFEPWVSQLSVDPAFEILERAPLANRLLGEPCTLYPGGSAALSSWADEHTTTVKAFLRAYEQAVSVINTDWSKALEVLGKYESSSPEVLSAMAKMNWVIPEPGHAARVQQLLQLYAEHGITEHEVDAINLFRWNNEPAEADVEWNGASIKSQE